jgi:hypothetical protein
MSPAKDTFEWADPPPPSKWDEMVGPLSLSPLDKFCKLLAERPGQWAVFKRDWKGRGVGQLTRRHSDVEWVMRKNPDSEWDTDKKGRKRPTSTIYGRLKVGPDGRPVPPTP